MRGNVVRGGEGFEPDEPLHRVSSTLFSLSLCDQLKEVQPVELIHMPITKTKFLVEMRIVSSRIMILQHFLEDILVFIIQLKLIAIFAKNVDAVVVIPKR